MFARKLVISLFGFILPIILATFYILPVSAFAQTPIQSGQAATPSAIPLPATVSPTSPLFTDLLVHNIFHTFSCLAVGQSTIGQPCLTYQLTRNVQGNLQGVPVLSSVDTSGGVLGTTTSLIGALYANPPVRTADYLASLGEGMGIVKTANAQVVGSGAEVLRPIEKLWSVSRNIAYVVMIVIFVIIGLMVMFRQRINPQTVITAQAALPGLVIGLILITFSYFLAGLISDMAFVGTNVVGYYFAAAQGKTDDPARINLVNTISDKNVLNLFGPLTGIVGRDEVSGSLDSILNQLPGNVQFTLRLIVGVLVSQFFGPVSGGIGSIATSVTGNVWGFLVGPLVSLATGLIGFTAPTFTLGFALAFIATLVLIYSMIKLLLRLVSAFLTIIFLTISAPFQFLAAALPGRQAIATGWIVNMLANILIFPAVLAVLYFVVYLLGPGVVGNDYPLKISNPNQIVGTNTFPLFGGLNLDFIYLLLAFGALIALPSIPDIVIRTVGRIGQAGQLIGQEIRGDIGQGRIYAGQFQSGVSSTGSNLRSGLFGETQYTYDKEAHRWVPYYGKPGLFSALRRRPSGAPAAPER